MLKKRLGVEAIEKSWYWDMNAYHVVKIPPTLIIPEGCEKIGQMAFEFCKSLKKVVISNSVKEIGFSAFDGCSSLREVEIPESVEKIGNFAFEECGRAIVTLRKPESEFKFIGNCSLDDCKSVEYVEEKTGN